MVWETGKCLCFSVIFIHSCIIWSRDEISQTRNPTSSISLFVVFTHLEKKKKLTLNIWRRFLFFTSQSVSCLILISGKRQELLDKESLNSLLKCSLSWKELAGFSADTCVRTGRKEVDFQRSIGSVLHIAHYTSPCSAVLLESGGTIITKATWWSGQQTWQWQSAFHPKL